jgi:hypothetical protein
MFSDSDSLSLTDEIWLNIFKFFLPVGLVSLSRVNRQFYNVAMTPSLSLFSVNKAYIREKMKDINQKLKNASEKMLELANNFIYTKDDSTVHHNFKSNSSVQYYCKSICTLLEEMNSYIQTAKQLGQKLEIGTALQDIIVIYYLFPMFMKHAGDRLLLLNIKNLLEMDSTSLDSLIVKNHYPATTQKLILEKNPTALTMAESRKNDRPSELLRTRILLWAREEIQLGNLSPQSIQILEAILYRGEISRGEMTSVLNVTDRHARRLTSTLIEKGILISDSPKSPLKLAFPATFANRWMPGLFPP